MNWFTAGLYHAATMAWETFWALVLGFAISGALQVFVSKDQMGRLFGRTNLRSMSLATVFGAASSSCSYAAAAAARSAFKQGAALIPALAFMFASTNLVIELGAVLWLLMGWRFVLAEVIGSFVLIGLMWLLGRLIFPRNMEEQARRHVEGSAQEEGGCHHEHGNEDHAGHEHMHRQSDDGAQTGKWQALSDAFVMDWQMLWKEIVIGFLIAGFLAALVPTEWWRILFLQNAPAPVRLVENAIVGPLIAAASFVCSVGNIPLASVLWSGGISFGGVVSFIFADLIVFPLVFIYRKYYGFRAAAYITGVFFLSMVGAGIVVDLLFSALGLIPQGPRPASTVAHAHFAWNYTTWLDLVALAICSALIVIHRRQRGSGADGTEHSGHNQQNSGHAGHSH